VHELKPVGFVGIKEGTRQARQARQAPVVEVYGLDDIDSLVRSRVLALDRVELPCESFLGSHLLHTALLESEL